MPLAKDKHEEILGKLLNPELPQSERTDLLQELRVDYGAVLADHEDHTTKIKTLSETNTDLVVANSKLFRQIGRDNEDDKKEDDKKSFSESITIEKIERGNVK
jgi:regulator of replication initiation timing